MGDQQSVRVIEACLILLKSFRSAEFIPQQLEARGIAGLLEFRVISVFMAGATTDMGVMVVDWKRQVLWFCEVLRNKFRAPFDAFTPHSI